MGAFPVAACGGDDSPGPGVDAGHTHDAASDATTNDATTNDATTNDATANDATSGGCDTVNHSTDLHTHSLTIPKADVTAGVDKDYTLGGGHTHAITVTAAMFTALKDSGTTMLVSATAVPGGGHMHNVTLTCA